jgi:cysteine dioxygenase
MITKTNNSHISVPNIATKEALVNALQNGARKSFNDIFRSIDVPASNFKEVCSWSNDSYTRNCLACTDEFELILICWEKGQITPIHDHGGEECWVKIIDGSIKETIYEPSDQNLPKPIRTLFPKTGDVTYMVDFMGCHRLENKTDGRAMTLHLYAKPINSCNIFDEDCSEFISKDMSYDTINHLEVI